MEIHKMDATDVINGIKEKNFSALEVTNHYLSRIEKFNSKLNAFTRLNTEAISLAKKVDEQLSKGEDPGPLAGLPVGIKDLFCTQGIETNACSKILSGFVPPYTATCVRRLEKSGAIVLGKTNMDEFAMGSSNETSFSGKCYNPWNTDYVPGGSSGGSASAVAARLAPIALGSDTGGSIRQPCSFTGLVGIKPTYGRISRFGMIAFASSLDQAGPMGLSVRDCALFLEKMSGHDEWDSTTSQRKVPAFSKLKPLSLKGIKIGLAKEYMSDDTHPDVKISFEKTISNLKAEGAQIVEVTLPHTKYAVPVYYLVATSEASSNLSRYDGVKFGYRSNDVPSESMDLDTLYLKTRSEGFGEEVKRRIILGTYALSSGYYDAYYKKACQVRRLILNDFNKAFVDCDLILSPVSTTPAFKSGERISDPVKMYLNDVYTTPASLAGLPAMSLPMGISKEGLPIGLQILAPHFSEEKMISAALTIESFFNNKGIPSGLQ